MSILIDSVTPHTPAAKAGILAGDRLVAVNGNLKFAALKLGQTLDN